ncbi:MAG: ATP-dependent Clp protease proteolytic subunit [Planctomycetota bacterium]
MTKPFCDDEDDDDTPDGLETEPKVIITTKDGKKVVTDIATRLMTERIIWLGTDVNNRSANRIVRQLTFLALDDPKKPITLYLNSPGGSIVDGMAIYDTIKRSSAPVHCIVSGMAASMGAVILSGCAKGHRKILAHGEVLLHQPLGGARGQATDVEISAKRILKMKETLLQILAANCGQPFEKVAEDCDRDYWLDASEAKAYGIVDEILK